MSLLRRGTTKKSVPVEEPAPATATPVKKSRFGRSKSNITEEPVEEFSDDAPDSAGKKSVTASGGTRKRSLIASSKSKDPDLDSNSLLVKISTVELFDSKATNVLVEVDMPGEKKHVKTKPAALVRGKANLDWEKSYAAGPKTELRKAITAAFGSEDGDTEVQFVLYSGEKELGAAMLDLKGLLDQDRSRAPQTLDVRDDKNREVGSLTCSVSALALLQEVDDATDESKAIRIDVPELELVVDAKQGAPQPVRLTIDMLGIEKMQSSSVTPTEDGDCSLDFQSLFHVTKGGKLAKKLQHALQQDPELTTEGRVHIELEAIPAGKKTGKVLGEAYISLPELFDRGRDMKAASVKLFSKAAKPGALSRTTSSKASVSKGAEIATMTISVAALPILRELDRQATAAAAPAAAPAAAAPLPAPATSTSRRARAAAAEGAVEVSIGSVELGRAAPVHDLIARKRINKLWVVVTSPGDELAKRLPPPSHKTAEVRLDDGRCTFDERASLELAAGGAFRSALASAVAAYSPTATYKPAKRGDSVLTFVLKGLGKQQEEHELGSVAYDLIQILDAEQEARDVELKLVDGRDDVGTLTCSISALPALRALDKEPAPSTRSPAASASASASSSARAAAAQADEDAELGRSGSRRRRAAHAKDGIEVTVSTLKLDGASQFVTAQVELDMLGTEPARSAPLPLQKGAAMFGWEKTYDAGAGTELRKAIAAALRTEEGDSDVQFVVYATEARGGEKEVGMAVVSLEGLLKKRKDQPLGAVSIKDEKNREVGTLTLAVNALTLLEDIEADDGKSSSSRRQRPTEAATESVRGRREEASEPTESRRGSRREAAAERVDDSREAVSERRGRGGSRREAAEDRSKDEVGPSARSPFVVSAGRFVIGKSVKLERSATLKLQVDVLGVETLKSKAFAPKKGEVDFALDEKLKATVDSALADALEEVVLGATEENSTIAFTVLMSKKTGEDVLGSVSLSIRDVLHDAKDAKESAEKVMSNDGFTEVGRLGCSVKALEALEEIEDSAGDADARQARVKARGANRTTTTGRRAGKRGPGQIEVKVTSVQLSSSYKFERGFKPDNLELEVDMLDIEKKPERVSAPMQKSAATFDYDKTFDAGAGTELRKAIAAALRTEEGDSDVQFVVYATEARGGEKEVGLAVVSLEGLLKKGKDQPLGKVSVKDEKNREVGTLTLALTAFEVLQDIEDADVPPAVEVEMTALKLNSEGTKLLRKVGTRASVVVEVDMLDVDALLERTKKTTLSGRGDCTLDFKKSYDAAPGSTLQSAILRALRAERGSDDDFTEVQFVVMASDAGSEVELGAAVLRLDSLLEKKKDHLLGAIPVMNKSIEVGKITVGVKALAALRAIDAGGEAGAPISVRVRDLALLRSEPREAWVEVDMLGVEERTTGRQVPRGGACDFDWQHEYPTADGTPLYQALVASLQGDAAEEPDIIFRAYQADATGRRTANGELIGTTRCSLEDLLRRNAELSNTRLELLDARGMQTGSVTVSVSALVALRRADDEVAASQTLSVTVTKVELTSDDARKKLRRGGGVGVMVDMLGTAEDRAMAKPRDITNTGATLDFSKEYQAAPNSALRKAIKQAFESEAAEDSEVQFVLLLEDKAGRQTEAAQAAVSLEKLFSSNRDHRRGEKTWGPLPLLEMTGGRGSAKPLKVGEITCEVKALPLLRAINTSLTGKHATKHTGAQLKMSKRERERELAAAAARRKIVIAVKDVTLHRTLARRPPESLHVAIEFLSAPEVRTHALNAAGGGRLDFNHTSEFELAINSPMRDAVLDSLFSDQLSASVVHLSLFGAEGRAGYQQDQYMGGARFSLHDLLRSGVDLKDEKLEVRAEQAGGADRPWEAAADRSIATVTVSVTALTALKEVAAALTKYGSPGDAKIGELQEERVREAAAVAGEAVPGVGGVAAAKVEGPPWATSHADDKIVVRMRELVLERAGRDEVSRLSRQKKVQVDSVVLEIDMLGVADSKLGQEQLTTPPLAVYGDGTVQKLDYDRSFSTAPGSKMRSKLLGALESPEQQDSDVYFVLHAVARPLHASRVRDAKDEATQKLELASGFINLEDLLHQAKKDTQDAELILGVGEEDDKQPQKAMARLRLDVEALVAMERVQAQLQATRVRIQAHKVQLSKSTLEQFKGQFVQLGIQLLGLKEQKSTAVEVFDDELTYNFKFSYAQQTHHGAEGRAELLSALHKTPKAEQYATITLYGLSTSKQRGAKDTSEVLAKLELPLSELQPGREPKQEKNALEHVDPAARESAKRGGLKGGSAPGHVWLTVHAADALHWLAVEGQMATGGAARREYRGKQQGQEGVFVDGKRVEASAKTKKGFAALSRSLGHSVGDFTQALGALPDSYAPSLLAARQHSGLSMLSVALARQLPAPEPPPAQGMSPYQAVEPAGLRPSLQPSFAVELGSIENAPAPPGPQHLVARRSVRVCVVEYENSDEAKDVTGNYVFRGNVLTLPVEYDERDNIWRLDAASRLLLLRTPTPTPKNAVLLIELVLTMGYRAPDAATGAPMDAPPGENKVLVCSWAQMPLATHLADAASAMTSRAPLPPPAPLRLSGGTLFEPKQLHSLGGAAQAAAALANPPAISVAVVPLPPEFHNTAALLSPEVLVPVEYAPMLVGCRQLCLDFNTHQFMGGVGASLGQAEVQMALSGFALLSETPDTLRTLFQLWAGRRDAWFTAARGSRRGVEPAPVELATMLSDVVRTAHLLGRGGTSRSLPAYDSGEPKDVETRLITLSRFADRTAHDPLAMLCEDDPFLSYAPVRVQDLVVDNEPVLSFI